MCVNRMATGNTFLFDGLITTQQNVHYIPAKIEANQEANVEGKFSNRISTRHDPSNGETETEGVQEVELRGRPLYGATVQLPGTFNGFIANSTDKEQRQNGKEGTQPYKVVSGFSKYTYWNWDKKPSGNDAHVKLMDWLKVSEVLHAPIVVED